MYTQLFMVPPFRSAVLAFDGEADLPLEEREDSLMWQLQSMFAHLQESEKAYYNPKGEPACTSTCCSSVTDVTRLASGAWLADLWCSAV